MTGLFGIVVIIALAWIFSEDRHQFRPKFAASALAIQFVLAFVLLKVPGARSLVGSINGLVNALKEATDFGAQFIFGYLAGATPPFEVVNSDANFVIAFGVLPIVLTLNAFVSVLYHFGIIQKVVLLLSKGLQRFLHLEGSAALGVAASVFLGIVEAPIFVKRYLPSMSRSSLFTLLTAAMSTIAGTLMVLYATVLENAVPDAAGQLIVASLISAPAAVMVAQIIVPPNTESTEEPEPLPERTTVSGLQALMQGATEGISMVISITGILIVVFATVRFIDMGLALIPLSQTVTLELIFRHVFAPLCWLIGIPSNEVWDAARVLSIKTVMNEFVAYLEFAKIKTWGSQTQIILTYACCGVANFGSLGILFGGLSQIIPNRQAEVASLGWKALLAGSLTTLLTGAIAGLVSLI